MSGNSTNAVAVGADQLTLGDLFTQLFLTPILFLPNVEQLDAAWQMVEIKSCWMFVVAAVSAAAH